MRGEDEALTHVLDIIRSEFVEMPGLSLTRAQIQRLWALDAAITELVIAALTRSGFLRVEQGRYSRAGLDRP